MLPGKIIIIGIAFKKCVFLISIVMDSLLIEHISGQAIKALENTSHKPLLGDSPLIKVRHMTHFSVLNNAV
jgi:hypothetical protein